ncbi:hypothetical protein V6N13_072895 [Hibiscus sabdariffa]
MFMEKSAYCLCTGDAQGGESHLWNAISQYRGLPCVRMLLWLILKGKILTNSESFRRHMSNNTCCGLCGALEEDIFHLFRDCVEARLLWAWVEDWDIAIGTFLWNIWVNRNYRLFSPDLVSPEGIYHRSMQMIEEFGRASSLLRLNQRSTPLRAPTVARWEAPPTGWIKGNLEVRIGEEDIL